MSSIKKIASLIFGGGAILYLFTCTTFLPFQQQQKQINHDQIVKFVLTEVDYEIAYGDKKANIETIIDKAIYKALTKK